MVIMYIYIIQKPLSIKLFLFKISEYTFNVIIKQNKHHFHYYIHFFKTFLVKTFGKRIIYDKMCTI